MSGYSGLPFGHPIGNPDTPGICPDIPDIKFLFEREKNFFYFTVCRHLAHGKGAVSPCVQPKNTTKLDGVDRPLGLGADGTRGKNFAMCRPLAHGKAACLPCALGSAHGKALFRRVPEVRRVFFYGARQSRVSPCARGFAHGEYLSTRRTPDFRQCMLYK